MMFSLYSQVQILTVDSVEFDPTTGGYDAACLGLVAGFVVLWQDVGSTSQTRHRPRVAHIGLEHIATMKTHRNSDHIARK